MDHHDRRLQELEEALELADYLLKSLHGEKRSGCGRTEGMERSITSDRRTVGRPTGEARRNARESGKATTKSAKGSSKPS